MSAEDNMRASAYSSFGLFNLDLDALYEAHPDWRTDIDRMISAWNAYTLLGVDFGTAALLVMEAIWRQLDANNQPS